MGMEANRLQYLFDVFQANSQAMNSYTPAPYHGPLTLFCAEEETRAESPPDPTKGWGCLAKGGLFMRYIPGTHYTILQEPNVKLLAEELSECLSRTQHMILTV